VPIVFAHLIGLSLGSVFAWVAGLELSRKDGPPVLTPAFAVVAAFAAFVWLPTVGYFAFFHGDWSYLYLVERHPSAVDLALTLLSMVSVAVGFLAVAGPSRKRRLWPVVAGIGAPLGLALAALPFAFRRLSVSGTYAQYHGDFGTQPIGASLLGKGVVVFGVLVAVAIGWTVHALRNVIGPGR
jgi:hypothetical protein